METRLLFPALSLKKFLLSAILLRIMMEPGWKNDCDLAEDMRNYVRHNIQRVEMLDFLQRDYTYGVFQLWTGECAILEYITLTNLST